MKKCQKKSKKHTQVFVFMGMIIGAMAVLVALMIRKKRKEIEERYYRPSTYPRSMPNEQKNKVCGCTDVNTATHHQETTESECQCNSPEWERDSVQE